MRYVAILAFLGLRLAQAADDRRVPVVVELFTSEGCSSCPPADQLLARMDRSQPVAGVRVIALEEHVDYWNSLGWTDPFSSSQYRFRQNDYGRKFSAEGIYTPQMIVNGQAQFVGTDGDRAAQEIARAALQQSIVLELKATPKASDPDLVDLSVKVTNTEPGKAHNSNVYLAVTESDLSSNVQRGENSGRLLRHAPVVRSFGVIGKIDARGASTGAITDTLKLPREWKRENLRAVVFVQERDSFKITGAAITDLR
jgi:hypothetical protein